ncbi:hypothetical protein, partial [Pseudonocardia spinosispora]|uniref:hypothetical protein n=1 Tax=Pseudonocardia spinosispora TaxID=103441 RepID=UPI00055DE3AD
MKTAISAGRWCASTVVPLVSRALLSLSFGKVLAGAGLVWIAAAFIAGGGHARIAEPASHAAATGVTLAAATTADLGTGGEAVDDSGLTDWTTMSGGGRPTAATGTVSDVTGDEELPSWSDTLGQRPAGNGGGYSAQNSATRESIGDSPDSLIDPVLEFIQGVAHKVTGVVTSSVSSAADDATADAIQDFVPSDPADRPRVRQSSSAPASSGSGHASRTRSSQLAADVSADVDEFVTDQLARAGSGQFGRASNTGTSQAPRVPRSGQGVDELFTSVVDLASGIVSTVAGRDAGQATHQALSKAADQVESALARGAALNRNPSNAGAGSNAAQWGATDPRPSRQSAKAQDPDQTRAGSGGGHKVTDGTAAAPAGRATGCTLDNGRACEAAATVRDDVLSALRGRGPPAQRTDSHSTTHDGLGSGKNSGSRNSDLDERIESAVAQLSSRITSLVKDFVSERQNTGAPAGGENLGTGPTTGGQSGPGQGNAGGAAGGTAGGVLKLVGHVFSEVGQLLQQIGGKSSGATGQSGSQQGSRPGQSAQAGQLGQNAQGGQYASNPVDQLTQQITQVVQNWLVSNGLTGSARQPAPSAQSQAQAPAVSTGRRPSAAQTSPQDSEQPLPVVTGSGPGRPTGTSNGAATPRVPAGQGVDELFGSVVDLASGVVSTVAGREAGQRTHQVLSQAADEIQSALVKGAALNRGQSGTGTNTSGWATTTPRVAHPEAARQGDRGDGDGGRGPAAGTVPTTRGVTGCDADGGRSCDLASKVTDSVYSALRGRGPPASAEDSRNNSGDGSNGRAVRLVGQVSSQVGQFLDQLGDSMSSSSNGRPSSGQSARGSVPQQPGQDLSASITESVNGFVQDLLGRIGAARPTQQTSAQQPMGQPAPRPSAPSLDEAMSRFVDLSSGVVSKVAGRKAGERTRESLSDLADGLTDSLRKPARQSGQSHGQRGSAHGSAKGSIQEPVNDFMQDLFQRLGMADPKRSGGSGGGSSEQQPRGGSDLARSIRESTNDFVQDLLKDLGIGQSQRGSGGSGQQSSGNQGSGNQGSGDQGSGNTVGNGPGNRGGQSAGLQDFGQVLSGVVDMVSGLVTATAGEQAGGQTREMLTGAAQDVLTALAQGNRAGSGGGSGYGGNGNPGMSGSGGGKQTGGQQNGGGQSSLGAEQGQFAGTECQSDAECALADGSLRTRQPSSLGSRAPPPLLADDTQDTDQYQLASWYDSSSPTATNQALDDHLAVINGQKSVDEAKAALAKGSITQADYDKKVAAQKTLQTKADESMGQLSDYDSQLITDTVTGQQKLAAAKTALDKDKEQLDAGKLDKATYDKRATAYAAQQDEVYGQTEQLRWETGGSQLQDPNAGRGGAGAACSSTGAFGECATVAEDAKTGKTEQDRSLCLTGISTCSSSSTVGDRKASASCDLKGCKTTSEAGKTTAATTCGAGECNTSTVADSRGTDTFCQAKAGCTTSGKTPTTPDAADLAAGKQEGSSEATGTCTKNCALASFATKSEAGSDCNTSNGVCDTNSTGRRATETKPTGETAADTTQLAASKTPANTPAASTEASKDNGEASSKAHCAATTVGCDVSSSVRAGGVTENGQRGWLADLLYGDDENTTTSQPAAQASVRCAQGATGCTGTTETSTGGKTEKTTTTSATPAVAADPETGQAAVAATPAKTNTDNHARSGKAGCDVKGGSCTSSSGLGDGDDVLSYSSVDCDQVKGCTGKGTTATTAEVTAGIDGKTATRKTDANHECTVTGTSGGCSTDASSTAVDNGTNLEVTPTVTLAATTAGTGAEPAAKTDPVAELGKGLTAYSRTDSTLECGSKDCTTSSKGTTSGEASGDVKGVRDSNGTTTCEAHGVGGTCGSVGDTEVAHREAQPAANGKPATPAGPVSVSHADAQVRCEDSTQCGGKSSAATSARDTGISEHRRGSSTTADCTVQGGGCLGQASSDASTVAEYVQLDPKTGQPIKGQPTSGPTSTSRSAASIDCRTSTCSGTAHTTSAAFDGAVADGKPRTSEGTVDCQTGSGSCQVQTLSTANTGPGAARAYADGDINTARMPAGPSAASVVGGKMTCEGTDCTGKITATVTATDPSVSPDPRGNRSVGTCSGVSGGTCQAVVNGAASSGPDANSIAPMVQESSTDNATVTSTNTGGTSDEGTSATGGGSSNGEGKDAQGSTASQGGKNPSGQGGQNSEQPATAPGSSANSGGPTVPGASSWSSASATLTCDGSGPCKGTPRGVATGIDGPDNHNGAAGSRGPPEATGTTTSTCDTTGSACQAVSSSSSASGQVVADIYTEQYKNAATQATTQATEARQAADQAAATAALPGATAEQKKAATEAAKTADDAKKTATAATEAAKKPIPADALPATWSQSSSMAQCTGPGCTATTTGDTSGIPGASHTDATCTSTSSGCAVTSDATATLMRDSGQRTKADKNDKDGAPVPGFSGEAETGSNLICPEAGCTGKVTGTAKATAGQDGHSSTSTGEGDTACDGSGECNAGIRASVSTAYSAPGVTQDQQFATTTATIAASCDNGTKAGCPIHATSTTDSVGAKGVKSTTTATCEGGAGCMTGTSGTATPDMSQVSFQCGGAGGCKAISEGKAEAGKAKANAANDCTVGANGQCAGSVQVGASADGSALAGASCQGTKGAQCHYSYEASTSDSASSGGAKANANAHGSKSGEMGGGAVQVMAKTVAKDGTAQAAASCQGTEGTDCSYHFEASASSRSSDPSSKAWAKADAHGSEDGKMGGGAVQVMASTYAKGADAQAQSTCVGAKNCSSTYSAHAEEHDRADQTANAKQPDMPSGYWSANGAGTCSGSGKGGCGVHAWAQAGPGGSGGASCSGDCSGFQLEQSGNSFTQTGPSWNQIQAARAAAAARAAHQVKNLDEFMGGLKDGESAIGYKKTKDGYDIYTKEGDGPVKIDKCSAADCAPGKKIEGGGGQIVIPQTGNPETSRHTTEGQGDHKCDASVGCALSGDDKGKGDGKYWIEGDGNVTDGITASTLHYQDSKPAGNYPANRNEGSFGNTQGKPFTFTCNGGCQGTVSNYDLGKGKFTDKIDIQDTSNLLVGRDGLGNLGNYSHYGPGTITLEGRDHKMMEPIKSDTTDGLTPEKWADVTTKYGYTPWDVPTLKKVLGKGDTLTGFVPDGHGGISIVTKDADGEVQSRPCGADECTGGKPPIAGGGNGTVEFGANGDGTVTQPSVDGKDKSTCTSNSTCGIAATEDGSGMWWMNGNGNVHDGASRSVVTYSGQDKNTANGGTLANHSDQTFSASCAQGCTADVGFAAKPGDKLDHFDLNDAAGVQITARDADGHAGVIKWAGKGHFQSVEGDKVWADQKKAAWNPDEETKQSSDNATLIITRDAAGNPGYYALPTGQSGRIETKEGYVVDNRHNDHVDQSDYSPEDAYNYEHMGDVLKVITPNGDGKGGTLECGGDCTVSGPGLPAQNTPCANCHWVEHLATGEGPHPGGYREITNLGEKKTWYTPTGDAQTCDGCSFTQYNRDKDGNGGGAICTGIVSGVNAGTACSGRSREGTEVSDPQGTRLLYANADGTHTGWSCQSNSDSCGSDPKNLRFDWGPGYTPNDYWALAMDGGFRRPPTGSPIDKSMANDLGLKPGDALPALDADALARMKAEDAKNGTNYADEYAMNLPKLTSGQQDSMAFEYLNQQSTDRRLQNKYGDIYTTKIKPVMDAYRNAKSDGVLTGAEKTDLDKKFDSLDGIDPGLVYEWSAARGVIDGVADANYVRPDINKTKADMAGNPKLVNELAGPAKPGDTRAPIDRALDNVKGALGVDDKGNPNAPYNTSQNSMLSLRPIQTQLDTMNASYARDVADFNSRALAFQRNGGSEATREKLNAEQQTLDARSDQITNSRALLNAATEKIQGSNKDPEKDAKQATLRTLDEKFGRGSGDTHWSDRITAANSQLSDVTDLYNSLDQNDPQQKKWAEKLGMAKSLSSLNYTAVTRNMTERAPGNPIDRLELPSTGKQDLLFALTSAKNRPGYQNWTEDDLSEQFKKWSPDELAQQASQMSAKEYQQSIRGRALTYDESPDREVNKKAADSIRRLGGADGQVDAERMLYRKGSGDDWVPTMLYRVRDADGNVLGWIDADGSKYTSLDDYKNQNSMAEDSDLITRENWDKPDSPLKMTSAHYTSPVEKAMDYVIAPAMIIGGTIATFTGVGAVVGVPLIAGGTTWFVGKAGINIYERSQHWQSNSWSNPAAAADYISLGATALVGAGAFLRPAAVGASLGVRAAAAAPGVIGMSAFTGMYGANLGTTLINWQTMTPAQQDEAIAGLVSGGLMLASPAVGKGLRGGLESGRVPGGLFGIRDGSPMRPMVDTSVSRPAIDILGDVMRPGRPVPLRDVLNHTGLTEGAVRNAVGSGRGGSNPRFRLTEDSSGNVLLDPGGRVRPGAEGLRIRDIVSRQGVSDGNGGKTMTIDQVRAELEHQGVRVPDDAAISRMMGRIDGASTSGRGSDMVVSARAAEGTFRTVADQAPVRPAETGAPETGATQGGRPGDVTGASETGGSGATQGGRPGDATGTPAPVASPASSTGTGTGSGPVAGGTTGSATSGTGAAAQGSGQQGSGQQGSGTQGAGSQGSGTQGTGSQGSGAPGSGSVVTGSGEAPTNITLAYRITETTGPNGPVYIITPITPGTGGTGGSGGGGSGTSGPVGPSAPGRPSATPTSNPATGNPTAGTPGATATSGSNPSGVVVGELTGNPGGLGAPSAPSGTVLVRGGSGGGHSPSAPSQDPAAPTAPTSPTGPGGQRAGGGGNGSDGGTVLADLPGGRSGIGRPAGTSQKPNSAQPEPTSPLEYSPSHGPPGGKNSTTTTKPTSEEAPPAPSTKPERPVNRPDEQSGGPKNDAEPPLGPDKKCACEFFDRASAEKPQNVDPDQVRPATKEDQNTSTQQKKVEDTFDGHTEKGTAAELDQKMADAAPGTRFAVWIKGTGDNAGHMIFGWKNAETGKVEFFDGHRPVSNKAPENTRGFTELGAGKRDNAPNMADEIGEYVGAQHGRPIERGGSGEEGRKAQEGTRAQPTRKGLPGPSELPAGLKPASSSESSGGTTAQMPGRGATEVGGKPSSASAPGGKTVEPAGTPTAGKDVTPVASKQPSKFRAALTRVGRQIAAVVAAIGLVFGGVAAPHEAGAQTGGGRPVAAAGQHAGAERPTGARHGDQPTGRDGGVKPGEQRPGEAPGQSPERPSGQAPEQTLVQQRPATDGPQTGRTGGAPGQNQPAPPSAPITAPVLTVPFFDVRVIWEFGRITRDFGGRGVNNPALNRILRSPQGMSHATFVILNALDRHVTLERNPNNGSFQFVERTPNKIEAWAQNKIQTAWRNQVPTARAERNAPAIEQAQRDHAYWTGVAERATAMAKGIRAGAQGLLGRANRPVDKKGPGRHQQHSWKKEAAKVQSQINELEAEAAHARDQAAAAAAELKRLGPTPQEVAAAQQAEAKNHQTLWQIVWNWVNSRTGWISVGTGVVFTGAVIGAVAWPVALPAIAAMVAFQVRGTLNTAKPWLSNNKWVQRITMTTIVVTLTVNLPLHIRGTMDAASTGLNRWIAALFGVGDVTTLTGALVAMVALWSAKDISTIVANKFWAKVTARAGLVGALATLASIPLLVIGTIVAPDSIQTINLLVYGLTVGTFFGFGGEAAYTLGEKAWTMFGGSAFAKGLTKFVTVFSAATIAAYGMLYQLHSLPTLLIATGALAVGLGAHWFAVQPARAVRVLGRVVVVVVTAGAFWLLLGGVADAAALSTSSGGPGLLAMLGGGTAQAVMIGLTSVIAALPLLSALRSWIQVRGPPALDWLRAAVDAVAVSGPVVAVRVWLAQTQSGLELVLGVRPAPLKTLVVAFKWLVSPVGLSSLGTAAGLVGSYLIVDAHPLPGWVGMIAFAVRGLVNWLPVSSWFAESFLLKDKADGTHTWLKSVLNTVRPITQLININLLVLGMLPLAFWSIDYQVNLMFVIANAGFVVIGVPAAIASWNGKQNPAEASKVWGHVVRWSAIVAFGAVIVSIPLMGIQLTEPQWHLAPTQFLLIWSTYLGWMGESVFEIWHDFAAKRAVKKGTTHAVPMTQKRFWAKASAVSLVVYGIVYLLGNTPVLVGTSAALVSVTALLMWVINRNAPPASKVTFTRALKALGSPIGRTAIGYTVAATAVAVAIAVGPIPGYVAVAGFIAFAVRGTVNLLNVWFPNMPRWVKAGLAAVVALSWLVNLTLHLPAAFAAGGLPALINGLFSAADVLFLVTALPTALNLLVKARAPDNQATRWATWLAFPTITVAAGLLAVQLGFLTGPWVAVLPIAALTAGFVYLTQTKLAATPLGSKAMGAWTWWAGARFLPTALVTANMALAGYGLLRLWLEHRAAAFPTTLALAVVAGAHWFAVQPAKAARILGRVAVVVVTAGVFWVLMAGTAHAAMSGPGPVAAGLSAMLSGGTAHAIMIGLTSALAALPLISALRSWIQLRGPPALDRMRAAADAAAMSRPLAAARVWLAETLSGLALVLGARPALLQMAVTAASTSTAAPAVSAPRRVWNWINSRTGWVSMATGAVFGAAVVGAVIWPVALPAIAAMVAFQVRGTLNAVKPWLSSNKWVQRVLLSALVVTLTVNLPLHIRGTLDPASSATYRWIAALFGVGDVTTLTGTLVLFVLVWAVSNPGTVS